MSMTGFDSLIVAIDRLRRSARSKQAEIAGKAGIASGDRQQRGDAAPDSCHFEVHGTLLNGF